jgi:RimJ/RimL family protein N-acetyltransferase
MPEQTITLLDGSSARLRLVRSDDGEGLRDLMTRISARSLYLRFHHQVARLSDDDVRRFTQLDYRKSYGVAVSVGEGEDERIAGIGHYFEISPKHAEVAFLVADEDQGHGIATHILDALIEAGRENGYETFEAFVLAENRLMMEVFRATGLPLRSNLNYGTLFVEFPIVEPVVGSKHRPTPQLKRASCPGS